MTPKAFDAFNGGLDDQTADLLQQLIEKYEPNVDKHLARLQRGNFKGSDKVLLSRLDKVFIAAASAAGLAQGAGGASRKVRGGIAGTARRVSGLALVGAGVLYVLARARVQGLSASDPKVREALQAVMVVGTAVPLAQGAIDMLGRFGKPSLGVPRDPRTLAIIAAGGAIGLWAGSSAGRGLVDAVRDAFDGVIDGDDYRAYLMNEGQANLDWDSRVDWDESD